MYVTPSLPDELTLKLSGERRPAAELSDRLAYSKQEIMLE